jgi:ankyrin repeat protein
MFISEGININACDNEGQSALMRASLFGHNEMVRLLLDKGADIQIRNKETQSTALMEAVAGNHADVIRLLAQNGADVNEKDVLNRTPLHVACMWGFIEVADTLIELGAKTDALDMTDQTPLMVAEQNGNTKIVEFLKNAGVNK